MSKHHNWIIAATLMVMMFMGLSVAGAATIYVDDDACPGTGSGTTVDPYCKIQDAINAASNGNTVLVDDGTYVENINFNGKTITVKSENGQDVTIIDGSNPSDPNKGSVVTFNSLENENSVLDGFTITKGNGTGLSNTEGGGIYCNNASPTITNCIISANSALFGGGIACFNSSSLIINCTISGNGTAVGGGILCVGGQSLTITNCTISGNVATGAGGGIDCWASSPTITNCTISGNVVKDPGPSYTYGGGGIYCEGSSSPIIRNSIIWGNIDVSVSGVSGINEIQLDETSSLDITYSDIRGSWIGTGNIDLYPSFVDHRPALAAPTSEGNYHLESGSPCIDVGTSVGAPSDDIDGDSRPYDGKPGTQSDDGLEYDMGADEYVNQTVEATININPDTLNLKSKGKWVSGYIELPEGFDVADIDIETVELCYGEACVSAEWSEVEDDVLMVKFDRQDLIDVLDTGDAITLTAYGELTDETPFEGSDTIRVIDEGKKK